jgi:hypothetical protein
MDEVPPQVAVLRHLWLQTTLSHIIIYKFTPRLLALPLPTFPSIFKSLQEETHPPPAIHSK